MEQRTLGKDKPLDVPAIGLGCMGMTMTYGDPDPAMCIATIERAVELGANFLDTSDMYGGGKNEELVGRGIKPIRDKVILATKFGNRRDKEGKPYVDGRPEWVAQACDASLKRLGIDVIDLYYQHRIDPKVPIEETIGAMARLIEAGKVRYLGMSEAAAGTLRRAHAVHPITALQTEYSLFSRDVEDEILPTCRELGVGFVAYAPFGRGILTGAIKSPDDLAAKDNRRNMPRYQPDVIAHNTAIMQPLLDFAAAHDATPAQVALAWVLSRGEDIVSIPGTSKPARMDENAAALTKGFSKADLDKLGEAIDYKAVIGERYPAIAMQHVNK